MPMTNEVAVKLAISKLPKYVRSYVARLERQIDELKSDIAERDEQITETDTYVVDYSLGVHSHGRPLPPSATVRFTFPGREHHFEYIEVRRVNDYLDVRCGTDSIAFQPQSGNCGKLKLAEWW